jgi:hypothetical protein
MADEKRLYFTPSPQVKVYLDDLVRLGIYGDSRGQVVNWILGKEIMRLVEAGTLDLRRSPHSGEAIEE